MIVRSLPFVFSSRGRQALPFGRLFTIGLLIFGLIFSASSFYTSVKASEQTASLPKFFTYLKAVDPRIVQEMRYFGEHNFLGRRVNGYEAAECILTTRAARALKKVQSRLSSKGLSLKVYDCYRPQRAVNDFIGWAKKPTDTKTKAEFYPTLKKSTLFGLGYIARRSTHSRGSTVDLTIVKLPTAEQPQHDISRQQACFGNQGNRFADNSLDFGTGYDCFHKKSHTKSTVSSDARANRDLLVYEMARVGFENYRKEWWHFSLKNEPFKRKHFDFPITPYMGGSSDKGIGLKRLKKAVVSNPDMVLGLERKNEKEAINVEKQVDGQDMDSSSNYQSLHVVCVASDDVLNVREIANHRSSIVAALPSDALEVMSNECVGDISLKEWHGLDAIARKTTSSPWCHVVSYKLSTGGEKINAGGWVSGAFVAGDGYKSRVCRMKR